MPNRADKLETFKNYFRSLHSEDLGRLQHLYADNVVYRNPLHEIRGLVRLEDYYAAMCSSLQDCRFEYLDQICSDGAAYVKWVLHCEMPGKKVLSLRGVSHLQWRDKIEFHEDYFDMSEVGGVVAQQLPLFANLGRWLRLRRVS